jgi:hypothetical protein
MVQLCRIHFLIALLLIHGCSRAAPPPLPVEAKASSAPATPSPDARAARSASQARRIIRDAELTATVDDPGRAEPAMAAVAEQLGGFVVSSGRHQSGDRDDVDRVTIDLILRVPTEQFQPALQRLSALCRKVEDEKITGQDVTEEFVDLEARLRTERALEAQYLDILKDAKSVKDALDVHAHLGEVREAIEKAEGRKRFLENQTSLSTIHVTVHRFVPDIRTSGFGFTSSVRQAGGDILKVSALIVTGLIRAVGVLLPIVVILLVPGYYVSRLVRKRRARRATMAGT